MTNHCIGNLTGQQHEIEAALDMLFVGLQCEMSCSSTARRSRRTIRRSGRLTFSILSAQETPGASSAAELKCSVPGS